jgi:hypothetical protein
MRLLIPLALLLLLPVGARAQAPGADLREATPLAFESHVEPGQVRIGEPFTYTLSMTHAPEERYELALPPDLGVFDLLEQGRRREDSPGRSTTTFELKLSAFELGLQRLPDVPFTVSTPQGPLRFTASPNRTVEVLSTLPEDAQGQGAELKDIQPPLEVGIPSWRLLWWLLGAVVAGLLGWALVRWLRRPRARPEVEAPLLPLDQRTRQSLKELESQALPAQGRGREFYFRLSEIVRGYLGERYGFEALECTSTELMAAVRKLRAPGLPEEELQHFVSESDLIKYARGEASPDTCRQALAFGYSLLERTWPPPPPPTPAPAESHASGSRVP